MASGDRYINLNATLIKNEKGYAFFRIKGRVYKLINHAYVWDPETSILKIRGWAYKVMMESKERLKNSDEETH